MPPITLTVSMDETGKIAITGPIDQKVICYGLLEAATQAIAAHHAAKEKALVQLASALPSAIKLGT